VLLRATVLGVGQPLVDRCSVAMAEEFKSHGMSLTEVHKEGLNASSSLSAELCGSLANLAVDVLCKGPDLHAKRINKAAKALGAAPDDVEAMLASLAHLQLEIARTNLSAEDATSSLQHNGIAFPAASMAELLGVQAERKQELGAINRAAELHVPHYNGLSWRLDVQIASRSARQQTEPFYLLRLKTKAGDKTENIVMQSDYASLMRITTELQGALQYTNNYHARRMRKMIK